MRQRIQRMRLLFVNTLAEKGADRDFSFIIKQNGMFSFSGLTKEQVLRLREEFGVYAVASGRVNVAGMTPDNMAAAVRSDCRCAVTIRRVMFFTHPTNKKACIMQAFFI